MTRRILVLRAVILVQAGIVLWVGLSIWGVSWMLGQSLQARQAMARGYLAYGVTASALLTGVAVWQLHPVLRLLGAWDRDQEPDAALLSESQARTFSFPGQFLGQVALLVLIGSTVIFAVRMQQPGYPLTQALLEVAFDVALALGLALAVCAGLWLLLRLGVLQRIVLLRPWTTGVSFAIQVTLVTLLFSLMVVGLSGALTLAAVIHALEQATAEEQTRWLEQVVVPEVRQMPVRDGLDYVARLAGPGRVALVLEATGEILALVPLPAAVEDISTLYPISQPVLWRADASTLRVLAVPLETDRALGLLYYSSAGRSPIVMDTVQALAVLSLGELLLALVLGTAAGSSLTSTVRLMGSRLRSLVGEALGSSTPLAQTWPEELGELTIAVNHIQQQIQTAATQQEADRTASLAAAQKHRALQETMQSLTAPVIRVEDGLVIVPLTGYFDDERAARIRPNLLAGIAAQRARLAVIDLTGVTEATDALIECLSLAVHSAALMGCQAILTGAGPSVAWSLTQQQTDLASLTAHRDLEQGLAYAQARLRASP